MAPQATLESYRRRGAWLYSRCAAETDVEAPSAAGFAAWLRAIRPGLRTSTWRTYRLAAAFMLEGHPDADAPAVAAGLDGLPAPPRVSRPRRTSARRAKAVPPEDLLAILRAIGASRSRYAQILRTWIIATICTGLRPCEWASATLAGRTLNVRCAKFEEGWRGLSETRSLDLGELAPDDLDAVRRMAQLGAGWHADGEFAARHEACAALLRRTCAELWPRRPRRPTLYSFRHVFAANAKVEAPPEVVAALLGHAATRTAETHYGRRRDAWKRGRPPLPEPAPGATSKVRLNARGHRWSPQSPSA